MKPTRIQTRRRASQSREGRGYSRHDTAISRTVMIFLAPHIHERAARPTVAYFEAENQEAANLASWLPNSVPVQEPRAKAYFSQPFRGMQPVWRRHSRSGAGSREHLQGDAAADAREPGNPPRECRATEYSFTAASGRSDGIRGENDGRCERSKDAFSKKRKATQAPASMCVESHHFHR